MAGRGDRSERLSQKVINITWLCRLVSGRPVVFGKLANWIWGHVQILGRGPEFVMEGGRSAELPHIGRHRRRFFEHGRSEP